MVSIVIGHLRVGLYALLHYESSIYHQGFPIIYFYTIKYTYIDLMIN